MSVTAHLAPARAGRMHRLTGHPFAVNHRGGEACRPEEYVAGFETQVGWGAPAIDIDVYALSDGTLIAHHGTTLDANTTGTGAPESINLATYQTLFVKPSFADGLNWGYDSSTYPTATLDAVFAALKGKTTFWLEPKDSTIITALGDLIRSHGISTDCLVFSSGYSTAYAMRSANPAVHCGILQTSNTLIASKTPALMRADGVRWILADRTGVSDASITSWASEGLNVIPYFYDRIADKNAALALGARGVFNVEDADYMNRRPRATTDPYATGKRWAGQLNPSAAVSSSSAAHYKGIVGSSKLQFPSSRTQNPDTIGQGWCSPIAGFNADGTEATLPATGSVSFDLTWDFIGDTTRYYACFLTPTDTRWTAGSATPVAGYRFACVASGSLRCVKYTASAQVPTEATVAVTAPVAGEVWRVKCEWTATQVKHTIVDRNGVPDGTSATLTDSTYRTGGYVWFTKSGSATNGGLGVSYSNVVIA